jgi:DNA-3-methyladenine glycosylase
LPRSSSGGNARGIGVETEAYFADNDEACHSFSRPSARAFVERNQAGTVFIYFSYGAHWMLNVLVKGEANGFVLICAIEPIRGIELMKKRRGIDEKKRLCSGPGKSRKRSRSLIGIMKWICAKVCAITSCDPQTRLPML